MVGVSLARALSAKREDSDEAFALEDADGTSWLLTGARPLSGDRIGGMNDLQFNARQLAVAQRFHDLHTSDCFVMPNPWDAGSAVYLERLGFKALATTSAGFAFSQGLPDSVTAVSRDLMLAHIRDVSAATLLPVNADFQTGYAEQPEDVAANVALCIRTGVAGLSIEDASGVESAPLYDFELAVQRVRAARQAIDASRIPVVLTARCEAFLVGQAEPARVALDRIVAFAEAGADCLFAPGVRDPNDIATMVKAVEPKPLNVLLSAPSEEVSVSRLADLGVRRISVGSGLARVAWGAFMRAAKDLAENNSFAEFAGAASFGELDEVMSGRS
jgi:2-methylisocitrate lyase-like PEP mutase family enzyme